MFSADELLNSGQQLVGYGGFDYTGKKQKGQVNFNDFFTKKDANGNYTRDMGALRPNYIAGYILDKFQFKDILFNVGVRIDRFDANTKTLKDPYSLYEVRNVASARNATLLYETDGIPSNIKDDYVVYVNNNEASTPKVVGYRSGDDWYDYTGRLIEDPTVLKNYSGGRDPQPLLVNNNIRMQDSTYNPNSSFTDYKPQVNVMPRLSFSFPISDVALFYAHYDVIVQRPDNIWATPADYFYLQSRANQVIENPGLKPQRMFDYEVGFKQQLTQRSAITLSGFYKERKDMIQVRPYLFAWPQTYYTFGNRDFSTVKGMTVRYDLRRMGNIRMDIAYTLQFADGTGSSSSSANGGNSNNVAQSSLLSQFINAQVPNLRYATALNIDSRHSIVGTLDYRFDDKSGPVVGGKHILENAGANFIFRARSGEPYTRHQDAYQQIIQGELNGARLPWHYNLDLRVDKDFSLSFGKKRAEGEAVKKQLYLNAYVLINNVLNRRDVLAVDPFTGRPDNDAVLTSAQGIQDTQKQVDPQSFIDVYYINQMNPGAVNLPRRINIGLQLNF
jgi:outer membrane receptor protein involved in Fe transport